MASEMTTNEMLKEIWEKEVGINNAFHNACSVFLLLSQDEETNGRYLNIIWGGIVGVISASSINNLTELYLDYDGEKIWVYADFYNDGDEVIFAEHKRGDIWVDTTLNGIADYWDMSRF